MLIMGGRQLDNNRLMAMLGEELQRQNNLWKPLAYRTTTSGSAATEIGGEHRDKTVCWLAQLTRNFRFTPETFHLSVTILDRFLQAVKARPKHLNCIGVAAFYLAAKTVEEDEVLPGTLELVQKSQCGCSMSEVLRMERCILDKLGWDLRAVTPLHFLHIYHSLLMANYPRLLDGYKVTWSRQLRSLTYKLGVIMENSSLCLQYPPSTLALALLSLELELCWKQQWIAGTMMFCNIMQEDLSVVITYREHLHQVVKNLSEDGRLPTSLYVPTTTGRIITAAKRKVEQMTTDSDEEPEEEDFYDGIKRLYSEETPAAVG